MRKTAKVLVKQAAARLKTVRAALANSPILNCLNTAEDITDNFAHATIEALRTYAAELRTYAVGLRQHLDIVRQMNNADVKINAWDNRLQTLLAEFQDTSSLLSELQRRTDNIVSNLSSVAVPNDAPDDCVLLLAKIDFNLMEDTANYAEFHADNFMTLYPHFGCTKALSAPCGYTEEDRRAMDQVKAGVDELVNNRRTTKGRQRANGKKQAHHIREYNDERMSDEQKAELKKAVQKDKTDYPDPDTKRARGYWKDLLTVAPSFPSAEALRKAVIRKRDEKRGKYDRAGKKRGPYKKNWQ